MPTNLTVNGTAYAYPATGDQTWGAAASGWAAAVTSGMLQKSGGTFTLTADANFGPNFGLLSKYFTSQSATPAVAGALRLSNTDLINWRNAGNTADLSLSVSALDALQFNSVALADVSSAQTLTNKSISGSANTITNISLTAGVTGTLPIANGGSGQATQQLALNALSGTQTSGYFLRSNGTNVSLSAIQTSDVPAVSTATASTIVLRDANANSNFGALTMGNVSAGVNNVGMGGPASASGNYPLLIQRDVTTPINAQLANPDTSAGTGAKWQLVVDNGNNTMEMSAFTAATAAPDIYAGGRGVIRATGALTGITLVADTAISSDIKMYAGGDAITNRMATINSLGLTLGVAGSLSGALNIDGSTSGAISILPQAAAGTWNFNLPISAGSSGQVLTSAGGLSAPMTWTAPLTNPMTTGGDIIYGGTAGAVTRLANGGTGQLLMSAGGTAAPTWAFPAITSVVAAYTALATDSTILCSGAAFTVTLPTAVGVTGKQYSIKKTDASLTNQITIATTLSQTIDGALTKKLSTQYEQFTLVSDGSNWQVIDHAYPSLWVAYTPTFTNLGTVTGISFFSRRTGDSLQVRGSFIAGTGATAIGSISIGFGGTNANATADTTKLASGANLVGHAALSVSATTYFTAEVLIGSATPTVLNLGVQTSTGTALAQANGSQVSGDTAEILALIPISGWEG